MKQFTAIQMIFIVFSVALAFSNVHCSNYKSSIGAKSKILKSTKDQSYDGKLSGSLYFYALEKDSIKGSYSISQNVLISKTKKESNYTSKSISTLPATLKVQPNEEKTAYQIKIEVEAFQTVEGVLLKTANKELSLMLGSDQFAFEVKFTCDSKECDKFYMSILSRDLKPTKMTDTFCVALPPVQLWLNEKKQLLGATHDFSSNQPTFISTPRIEPFYFLKNISEFDNYEWKMMPRWN